jgi:PHD/YefM family antitoxin component YafN of YafNO toxin-antitoxin module
MKTTQLLEKVQFIIDAKGEQSAVLLNMEDWEQLLTFLEELEDAEEICRLREEDEEAIPWEQTKIELGLEI